MNRQRMVQAAVICVMVLRAFGTARGDVEEAADVLRMIPAAFAFAVVVVDSESAVMTDEAAIAAVLTATDSWAVTETSGLATDFFTGSVSAVASLLARMTGSTTYLERLTGTGSHVDRLTGTGSMNGLG